MCIQLSICCECMCTCYECQMLHTFVLRTSPRLLDIIVGDVKIFQAAVYPLCTTARILVISIAITIAADHSGDHGYFYCHCCVQCTGGFRLYSHFSWKRLLWSSRKLSLHHIVLTQRDLCSLTAVVGSQCIALTYRMSLHQVSLQTEVTVHTGYALSGFCSPHAALRPGHNSIASGPVVPSM